MKHHLYIGTSGWNYGHWKGVFYPEDLPSSEWLSYYSQFFGTVEINYSFYRLPERKDFEKWREETPKDFIFAVKGSRFITHMKKLKDPQEPLERLFSNVRGLGDKLGPILYQLPPYWHLNLDRFRAFLADLPTDALHVMEFRDPSWLTEPVFDLLTEHSVGHCIMSAPSLPRVMRVTAAFAYIRMHSGGQETEGRYDDIQLEWWAEQIQDLLKDVDVYVYFNNDYKGFAVENARTLWRMIRGAGQHNT